MSPESRELSPADSRRESQKDWKCKEGSTPRHRIGDGEATCQGMQDEWTCTASQRGNVIISPTNTGTEFSYNLNVRGSRFFSRASSWESEVTPWFQLCTTLRRTAEPAQHFGLQNCEIISGCCQLLRVCSVTAAIEDKGRDTGHQSRWISMKERIDNKCQSQILSKLPNIHNWNYLLKPEQHRKQNLPKSLTIQDWGHLLYEYWCTNLN